MPRAEKKKKKRKFLATLVLDAKHPPTTLQDILHAMFPNDPALADLGIYLMFRARDKGGWYEEDWLEVILDFLAKYSRRYNIDVNPKDVDELLSYYKNKRGRWDVYTTDLNKEIFRKAQEVGLKLGTWQYRYYAVLRRLRKAGMLYEESGQFGKSREFKKMIQKIEEAYSEFLEGAEEPPSWLTL